MSALTMISRSRSQNRLALSNPVLLLAAAMLGAVVGVVAGINPEYGLLIAVGVLFAGVVIGDVTLGFVLFTFLSFLDLFSSSGSVSVTKAIGLILLVSWLVTIFMNRGKDLIAFVSEHTTLVVAMVAMLLWTTLSFAWAESPGTALGGAGRYGLDMMLIPIAFAAIRSPEHVKWTLGAYVLGALASSLYGLLVPTAATSIDVGRLTGTVGDANTTAIVAVAAVPLLVALVAISKRSALVKSAAAVAMVILFASLVSTLSREGLVALGLVLVGGVVFGGRWRAGMAVLLIVGVAATGGYYFVLAPLSARNRVTSSNTSGRSSLYTIAFRVFETHPVLGVGMDNFPLVEGRYVDLPGAITRADDVIDTPKEAHDAALETLAELGVPGLVTLLLAWGGALLIGIRAAKLFERLGRTDMELISRSVVLALVAVFTGDAFGPAQFGKYLWILLALCPVLLSMARREARKRTPPRRAAVPART